MKDEVKVKRGKISRAQGNAFEKKVREDLESKGWIVDKWSNNVVFSKEIDEIKSKKMANSQLQEQVDYLTDRVKEAFHGELVQAKPKYLFINGGMRMVGNNSGFPDFITFKPGEVGPIVGVESKMTGELDRPEKDKCKWLLDSGIFDKILIAEKTKVKNRVVIVYHDFKEKYFRFYK